jgi:hypothetical protein
VQIGSADAARADAETDLAFLQRRPRQLGFAEGRPLALEDERANQTRSSSRVYLPSLAALFRRARWR